MLRSVHSQTTDLKGQASAQLSWTQESTSRQFIITFVPKKRCSKRCSRAGFPSSTMNECEDSRIRSGGSTSSAFRRGDSSSIHRSNRRVRPAGQIWSNLCSANEPHVHRAEIFADGFSGQEVR